MEDNTNPNNILAREIVLDLIEKRLILDENADTLASYLADGKMKDTIWKKAFENKIATNSGTNEA